MEHTEKFDKQTAAGPEVTERPDAGPEVIQEVDLLISEVTEMPIDSVTPGEIEETEVSSDEPMDDGGDDDFLDVETSAPAPESYPAEVWDLLSVRTTSHFPLDFTCIVFLDDVRSHQNRRRHNGCKGASTWSGSKLKEHGRRVFFGQGIDTAPLDGNLRRFAMCQGRYRRCLSSP